MALITLADYVGGTLPSTTINSWITAIKQLQTRVTNVTTFWSQSLAISTASTSYIDISGMSVSFTKNNDATTSDVLVYMTAGFRAGSICNAQFGVTINGVDLDICEFEITSTFNSHFAISGFRVKPTGIAPGTYTIQGRVKRNSGTGTIVADGSDTFALAVMEILK